MINFSVRHTVADYAKWRAHFDAHESVRRAGGSTGVFQIYRDLENPNLITVMAEWDNAERARKFASNPALKAAMEEGRGHEHAGSALPESRIPASAS